MVAKGLCIIKTKKILDLAKKLRTAVYEKTNLQPEEWESHYRELGRIEGDLSEVFHSITKG